MTRFFMLKVSLPDFPILEINDVASLLQAGQTFHKVLFIREQVEAEISRESIQEFAIEETGDLHPEKVCDRCFKLLLTESAFENNRIKKHGVITKRPSCRSCRKVKNGVPIAASERKKWETVKPEKYSIFECPICQKNSIAGITKIVLDHSHVDGTVRGWLCESCNTGIGRFDDHPELVSRARDWLLRAESSDFPS